MRHARLTTVAVLASSLARPASARAPDPPVTAPAPQVDYLVVTDASLAPSFAPLVAEKVSRGLRAEVRTLDEIRRVTPAGRDDPETIREYLRIRHEREGLRYVLLGGDTDVVPPRMMKRDSAPPFDEPVACDAYFAGLDGTWDTDGDDVFGEWADDVYDTDPELAVGRAPVRTAPEADTFVAKTLAFAATRDSAFRNGILFLSESNVQDFAVYSESMISMLADSPAALDIVRRYENDAAWPGSLPLSRQTALGELSNGNHALAFHLGVAVCDWISAGDSTLTGTDLATLGNATPFVLCSLGTTSPLTGDCAVEQLLRAPAGGGVAALGTSGVTFTAPLLHVTTEILREVYVDGAREIGEAVRRAVVSVGAPDGRYLTTWTLLGDPELDLGPTTTAPARLGAGDGAAALHLALEGPNPSGRGAHVRFDLPEPAETRLAVHDVRGRLVRAEDLGRLPAGRHRVWWDARDRDGARAPSGIYFLRLTAGGRASTAKIVVLD